MTVGTVMGLAALCCFGVVFLVMAIYSTVDFAATNFPDASAATGAVLSADVSYFFAESEPLPQDSIPSLKAILEVRCCMEIATGCRNGDVQTRWHLLFCTLHVLE